MKTFMSIILIMLLMFVCGCGEDKIVIEKSYSSIPADDDTTDDDDDTSDDDDDDDDDDATGNVTVSDIEVGTCDETSPDPTSAPLNIVEIQWHDSTLYVTRKNAIVNCDVTLDISCDLTGGVLTITEIDSGMVDCMCTTDVTYVVNDIPDNAGNVNLVINYASADAKGCDNVADFNFATDLGDMAWHLAFLEVVIRDALYLANQTMNMQVGACYLEDLANTQIYSTFVEGYVSIYVLDQRQLPLDPDAQSAQCSMIDYAMPGLPAGDYNLIGPAREADEYTVWEDVNNPMTVEQLIIE